MTNEAKDSHLKNPPSSAAYNSQVARIRMKGFHRDDKNGNELDASAVYLVDPNAANINVGMKPWGNGTPVVSNTAYTNDSDVDITVPATKVWAVHYIAALIVTTATVGNRFLNLAVLNSTPSIIYAAPATAAVAASSSGQICVGLAMPASTTIRRRIDTAALTLNAAVQIDSAMPVLILPAGSIIRVKDSAAIDAAADDMTVVLHYVEYDA